MAIDSALTENLDHQAALPRSLKALLVAQLFGAINDNLLKVLTSLLALQIAADAVGKGGASGMGDFALSGIMFVLPYLIFAPASGGVADRCSKTTVIRAAKVVEVLVMIWATFCLYHQSFYGLLVALFLIGIHSTFFSPSKYGILPELLTESQLSRGNGYLELATFVGCIIGTAIVGPLKQLVGSSLYICGIVMTVFACIGLTASLQMTKTTPASPTTKITWNSLAVFKTISQISSQRALWLILLANGYFWSVAAFYQQDILLYAKSLANLDDTRTSLLLGVLGIGIGAGSVFAGRVSAGKVELGLVPIGAAGIALASFILPFTPHSYPLTLVTLLLLGLGSGCFIVPLNAYFQHESPEQVRGSYISASNFIAYAGMLVAYIYIYCGSELLKLSASTLMFFVGATAVLVLIYLCRLMPVMLLRCINWLLAHTIYSMKVLGATRVPEKGPALIICNHVAYVDPPLILAALSRPVRFIMYRNIYNAWPIHPFAKAFGAIPISPEDKPRQMLKSFEEAREALKNGELVCIFAEGAVTRIGHMLGFRKGFERIVKDLDVPIVPAYIDQIWGSIFSNRDGKFFWKIPRQLPYPVTLAFDTPVPATTPAWLIRQKIQELSAELAMRRRNRYPSLGEAFLHLAKRNFQRLAVSDTSGKQLKYGALLVAVLVLRKRLQSVLGSSKMVGIMLPPSVGGVLANLSLTLDSRVPVNLNFTSGADSIKFALKKCEIERVITSRAFIEKIGEEVSSAVPGGQLYLEDLLQDITLQEKLSVLLPSFLLPVKLYNRFILKNLTAKEDLATVIFSSGSTAEPKGVMLSHGNIMSNVESISELFQLNKRDGIVGVLPLFHSFGFTASMWLPLLCGIRVGYHPSPVDGGPIGELVQRDKLTILMSTPTFLLGYLRKCAPEQFASLRLVVTGAEKLKDRVADAFYERFKLRPMEGFGATELSPVASFNVPDFHDAVTSQAGNRPGSVGRPVPGVSFRIVDIDTGETMPPEKEGLILVRGPNVMLGYLGDEKRTQEAIVDGWYVTGDLGYLDDEGFIFITDRLSRFSKIGGEMVPHGKVEDAIHQALAVTDVVCAVTAVPDEKKGEKLVVLSTVAIDGGEISKKLSEQGLPNLWIPKRESFAMVEALPYLGTGKLDLKQIKRMAADLFGH